MDGGACRVRRSDGVQCDTHFSLSRHRRCLTGVLSLSSCSVVKCDLPAGLIAGAARVLVKGGSLFVYGPFKIEGKHTSPSNEAFDERLQSQNSEWGYRCTSMLQELAGKQGLTLVKQVPMPANNFMLIFSKL
jgi:hypothetical protein